MTTDKLMSPEASPNVVPSKSGVRRVNNLPVYIVVTLIGVFLIILVLVASDRAAQQNRPQTAPHQKAGDTSMFANEIAGKQKDGIVPAQSAASGALPDLSQPPLPPPNAIPIARPELREPPASLRAGGQQRNDERDRIRTAKLQQFEEAVKANTTVSIAIAHSAGAATGGPQTTAAPATREEMIARIAHVRQQIDAQTRADPTAAYQARLQQLRAAGIGTETGRGSAAPPRLLQTPGNDVGQFDRAGREDRWRLDSQREAPRSLYELRAGYVIPALLISGINSGLPGQIVAQCSQDVYDTATGKYKLIPQGSRLVGAYSNDVAYGQARILVAWQRIIFPDGTAMDIGAMPGADGSGAAGFNDQVNNHYVRLFASAFLMSAITAGITYSQRQNQTQTSFGAPTASSALSEALGQQLGQATAQLIAKNMNIAPTLEIRPGYRFNVIVTKDLVFSKPY
jgi:type IV secretion system protein VirB10